MFAAIDNALALVGSKHCGEFLAELRGERDILLAHRKALANLLAATKSENFSRVTRRLPAATLRSLADARDSLNVAIAEMVYVALDPEETAEPLTWDVVAHALHLSVEDVRERYESYCRRRANEATS